jgi:hypothetical protein
LLRKLILKFKKETKGATLVQYLILLCIAAFLVWLLFPSLRNEVGEDFNNMTGNTDIAIGGDWSGTGVLGTEEDGFEPPILNGTPEPVSGVNNLRWKSGNVSVFGDRQLDTIVADAEKLDLNTITIPVLVKAVSATDSNPILETTGWESTKIVAKALSEKGYNVIIEPFPYIADGTIIETEWDPTDKNLWFSKWGAILEEIAIFAEEEDITAIYIASNLVKMESSVSEWTGVISNLRGLYNGKIIYRTNWWVTATWASETITAYNNKLNNPIFGLVDIIGIASYFEVTDELNPTKQKIKDGLLSTPYYNRQQNIYAEIKNISTKWNKPIFFGEFGIPAYEKAPSQPWAFQYTALDTYNEDTQANWFDAWYEVFSVEDWYLGYSVFAIADESSVYKVTGKKAELIIKNQDFN